MLKKILPIILLFSFILPNLAWADICIDVSHDVALKALAEIKKHKNIISYCSLCEEATPKTLKTDNADIVKTDENMFSLVMDGESQDLAYLYVKNSSKYENLGFISGCQEVGKHDIPRVMTKFIEKKKQTNAEIWQQSQNMAQEVVNLCQKKAIKNAPQTTADIRNAELYLNDCVADAIKKEIKKAFSADKQKEINNIILNIQKSATDFYWNIYNENKYCAPTCGTMAQALYLSEETRILKDMLARAIFLNLNKNGY